MGWLVEVMLQLRLATVHVPENLQWWLQLGG